MRELVYQSNERVYEKFTDADIVLIKKNYLVHTDTWIGNRIGKHKNSIRNKRGQMGLVKYHLRIKVKPEKVLPKEKEIQMEMDALIDFIETTTSEVWRDIAFTRFKQLKEILNKVI